MSTTNTKAPKQVVDARNAELKEYHGARVQALSKGRPYYIVAKATSMRNSERKIGFFINEMEIEEAGKPPVGRDVYVELVHLSSYEPLDQNRTLYRLRYNEYFRQEFEQDSRWPSLYYLPFAELEKVWSLEDEKKVLSTRELSFSKQQQQGSLYFPSEPDYDEMKDELMSKMTIRDFAAILWKAPVSSKPWLNKLIQQT